MKWEYKRVHSESGELSENELNVIGKNRWELISVIYSITFNCISYIFKRELIGSVPKTNAGSNPEEVLDYKT